MAESEAPIKPKRKEWKMKGYLKKTTYVLLGALLVVGLAALLFLPEQRQVWLSVSGAWIAFAFTVPLVLAYVQDTPGEDTIERIKERIKSPSISKTTLLLCGIVSPGPVLVLALAVAILGLINLSDKWGKS